MWPWFSEGVDCVCLFVSSRSVSFRRSSSRPRLRRPSGGVQPIGRIRRQTAGYKTLDRRRSQRQSRLTSVSCTTQAANMKVSATFFTSLSFLSSFYRYFSFPLWISSIHDFRSSVCVSLVCSYAFYSIVFFNSIWLTFATNWNVNLTLKRDSFFYAYTHVLHTRCLFSLIYCVVFSWKNIVWLWRHDTWKVKLLFAERENHRKSNGLFYYVRTYTRENVIRTCVGGSSSEAINTGAKPFNAITARRLNVFRTPLNCHAYVCSGYHGRRRLSVLIEHRFREYYATGTAQFEKTTLT